MKAITISGAESISSGNPPLTDQTIGEIVSKDFRKAEVFKKYQIDFCCRGKKTVARACMEKNVDLHEVQKELDEMDTYNSPQAPPFNRWDTGFLADYIVHTHHAYVREAIPVLMDYTAKVAKVHGDTHPEVVLIAEHFYAAAQELTEHMGKEENILFPYIRQLAKNNMAGISNHAVDFVKNPIRVMEHEHETVGKLFKTIRKLSANYTAPEGACTTYRISYLKLQEFEEDLHRHIHLENNILFPKSIQLENIYFMERPETSEK